MQDFYVRQNGKYPPERYLGPFGTSGCPEMSGFGNDRRWPGNKTQTHFSAAKEPSHSTDL